MAEDSSSKSVEDTQQSTNISPSYESFYTIGTNQDIAVHAEKLLKYGTWQWEKTTGQCNWSEGLVYLFGYLPESFGETTKPLDFFISHVLPQEKESVAVRLQAMAHEPAKNPFEVRISTPAGKQKEIRVTCHALPKSTLLVCFFQEINDALLPEGNEKILSQLESQEQLIRLAEKNFSSGSFEWDLTTDEAIWSNGMISLFGYTTEEFGENPKSGSFCLAHIPSEDLSSFQNTVSHYLAGRALEPFEQRILTRSGEEKILFGEWRTLAKSSKVICLLRDITQEKQKDATIQRQAELFRSIINNSPVCIVLYRAIRNEQGKIVDFIHEMSNPANNQATGVSENELIGKSWLAYYPENKTNGFFELYVNVVETGQEIRKTFAYDAHGIKGWFDGIFVKNGDGILFTYQDISAIKHQQQLIEQANSELLRSNTELENFAYVASHDLQEPLRKVKSFGGLLAKEYESLLQGNGLLYIQRMQMAVDRMHDLINDLLQYSRIGRLEEGLQTASLQAIVTDIWSQIREEKGELAKASRLTIDESLPVVRAIPSQMYQLFNNLFSNALKFARPEATPHIHVSWHLLSPKEKDTLGLLRKDQFAAISVKDNGIGFDPEYNEKIFGLFQRLHGRSEYEGSGIGLAICKRIMENHKGLIQASGESGKGATFRMIFPYESAN